MEPPNPTCRLRWAVVALIALTCFAAAAEAGKDKKRKKGRGAPAEQAAPVEAQPAVDVWSIYEQGLELQKTGALEEARARFEEAGGYPSEPIVWCYARLCLADVHFRLGHRVEDPAVWRSEYTTAQERFAEALLCAGPPPRSTVPAGGALDRARAGLDADALKATTKFREFGAEDLIQRLETVLPQQGEALIELERYTAANALWQLQRELYGPSRRAAFNVALACLGRGDLDCAADEALAADTLPELSSADPREPLAVVASHAVGLAAASNDERYLAFALGLAARWHELQPYDPGPREVLIEALVPRPRPERLRLLAQAEDCWIPTFIAEYLQQQGRDFVEEATLAGACGSGSGAQGMLAEAHFQEAKEAWHALTRLSSDAFNDVDRVRAHMRDVQQIVTKIDQALDIEASFGAALDLKSRVNAYLDQMRSQQKDLSAQDRSDTLDYCRQNWARFTWWFDRRFEMLSQTPALSALDDFVAECRIYTEAQDLDERVRKARAAIIEATALRRCQVRWTELKATPDATGLQRFEQECGEFIEMYDVKPDLQAARARTGG